MRAPVPDVFGDTTLAGRFAQDEYGSVRERFVHRSDTQRRSEMGGFVGKGKRQNVTTRTRGSWGCLGRLGGCPCSWSPRSSSAASQPPTAGAGVGVAGAAPTPVSQASTSTRGVTKHQHQRGLPGGQPELAAGPGRDSPSDAEYGEQTKAIQLFVKQINDRRRDQRPQDQPDHHHLRPHQRDRHAVARARTGPRAPRPPSPCSTGSGTGPGTTSSASPRKATPPSSASGRPSPTGPRRARPTCGGPDPIDAAILQAVVNWGTSAGLLAARVKVGVIAGDRASDQMALDRVPAARPEGASASPRWSRPSPPNSPRHRHHRQPRPRSSSQTAAQRRRHLGHPARSRSTSFYPGARRPRRSSSTSPRCC